MGVVGIALLLQDAVPQHAGLVHGLAVEELPQDDAEGEHVGLLGDMAGCHCIKCFILLITFYVTSNNLTFSQSHLN